MWKMLATLFKYKKNKAVDAPVETAASIKLKQEYEKKLQSAKEHEIQKIQQTFNSYHNEKALLCLQLLTEVARLDNHIGETDKKLILGFMQSEFSSDEVTNAFNQMKDSLQANTDKHFNIQCIIQKLNTCCIDAEKKRLVDFCKSLINADQTIDDIESSVFGFIRRNFYHHDNNETIYFSRCSNCGSGNFKHLGEKSLGEKTVKKVVPQENNNSQHPPATVDITMLETEVQWQCEECQHIWSTVREREKHENSVSA